MSGHSFSQCANLWLVIPEPYSSTNCGSVMFTFKCWCLLNVRKLSLIGSYVLLTTISHIAGWGRIYGGGPAADILQQAKLPLVSHSDCKKKYRTVDSSAHLCAGEGRASASGGCNGDSGGPLACEVGGKWYLHGAVSFGMRNCPTTHYTVFARVTSYKTWILEKIGAYIWLKAIIETNVPEKVVKNKRSRHHSKWLNGYIARSK